MSSSIVEELLKEMTATRKAVAMVLQKMSAIEEAVNAFNIKERAKWRDFRSKLKMKDRKEFDQMFSHVRYYNSNCMMQASPVVFHSVMISILFHHYKQLMKVKGMKDILLPGNRPYINLETGGHARQIL
jgi:hypothetical protein